MRSLALRIILNIVLVWAVAYLIPQYFIIGNEVSGIAVGLIVGALNAILRPVLTVILFPLKFLSLPLASIVVNAAFLYAARWLVLAVKSPLIVLEIRGGIIGWIVTAAVFGVLNWLVQKVSHGTD